MSEYFNLVSLILGLASWAIPIFTIYRASRGKLPGNYSLASLGCCTAALIFQLLEVKKRADAGDWSAIGDTIGAVAEASLVLAAVCLLLNITIAISLRHTDE